MNRQYGSQSESLCGKEEGAAPFRISVKRGTEARIRQWSFSEGLGGTATAGRQLADVIQKDRTLQRIEL
jgi:hypothetical protein